MLLYVTLVLGLIALLVAWRAVRKNNELRERIAQTNSRIYSLRRELQEALDQAEQERLTADEIMTPEVVTINGDIPIDLAAQIMLDKHIHRLLIVQGGLTPNRPVGVLSMSDIVHQMAKVAGEREELGG